MEKKGGSERIFENKGITYILSIVGLIFAIFGFGNILIGSFNTIASLITENVESWSVIIGNGVTIVFSCFFSYLLPSLILGILVWLKEKKFEDTLETKKIRNINLTITILGLIGGIILIVYLFGISI